MYIPVSIYCWTSSYFKLQVSIFYDLRPDDSLALTQRIVGFFYFDYPVYFLYPPTAAFIFLSPFTRFAMSLLSTDLGSSCLPTFWLHPCISSLVELGNSCSVFSERTMTLEIQTLVA